jgi:UPF0716 family protein affecting phage T7 exclusion
MLNINVLYEILNPEHTVRYLYVLLLVALIPLLDCYIILMTASYIGEYLFLAVLIALSLGGFYMSRHMIIKNLKIIRSNTENHYFSEYYYSMFPGTILTAIFLIMPGILGTIVALILSIPSLRYRTGRYLSNLMRIDWKEVHEFINVVE